MACLPFAQKLLRQDLPDDLEKNLLNRICTTVFLLVAAGELHYTTVLGDYM